MHYVRCDGVCDRWKRDRECVNVSTTDMSLFALKPVKGVWVYNCVCAVGEKTVLKGLLG